MSRKWYISIPVVLLAVSVTMAASAQALRIANVGDRMGSLVTGLTKIDGGPLGSCAAGAPVVSYVNYVVPGRPADDVGRRGLRALKRLRGSALDRADLEALGPEDP